MMHWSETVARLSVYDYARSEVLVTIVATVVVLSANGVGSGHESATGRDAWNSQKLAREETKMPGPGSYSDAMMQRKLSP